MLYAGFVFKQLGILISGQMLGVTVLSGAVKWQKYKGCFFVSFASGIQ